MTTRTTNLILSNYSSNTIRLDDLNDEYKTTEINLYEFKDVKDYLVAKFEYDVNTENDYVGPSIVVNSKNYDGSIAYFSINNNFLNIIFFIKELC